MGVSVSFFPSDPGFILYGSLTTLDLPFEAVSEFAFATARTFASRGSDAIAHALARSVGYMSLILFYMANSFHLARTPRLLLAHHKRLPPHFVGPLHLFRFSLDQASLRAGEGSYLLRSSAVRSFLAPSAVRKTKACDSLHRYGKNSEA